MRFSEAEKVPIPTANYHRLSIVKPVVKAYHLVPMTAQMFFYIAQTFFHRNSLCHRRTSLT
jgi:hypothetical protein